jgi:hypothetical protein
MSSHPTFAPPLEFQLSHVDMAGGLHNPVIATALVLCALLLATWMTRILVSTHAPARKLLLLGVLVTLSPLAARITEGLTEAVLFWLATREDPDTGFGFVGRAPLGFVPLVACVLTLPALGLRLLWRRAAAPHTR